MKAKYIVNEGYYHFCEDLKKYPYAWCYVVWSSRAAGKTYSALWWSYCKEIVTAYVRRTKNDVELICNENKIGFDASPYVPINRDHGTEIKAKHIANGIGGFYVEGDELPLSYVAALSAAKSLKGFDFSRCEWLIMDEFIPQTGEIVRRAEGEMLLDLYMTIRRDREKRGFSPLKLILFANAEDITTPITSTLEIVDDMADMDASGEEYNYNEERGILLHHVKAQGEEQEHGSIYAAMRDTAWGRKAFGGNFAHNDFTCVKAMSLKGFRPLVGVIYNRRSYYIYLRGHDATYYMCTSRADGVPMYDLSREVEQARFAYDWRLTLLDACVAGRMYFQRYTLYDLIYNYADYFKI